MTASGLFVPSSAIWPESLSELFGFLRNVRGETQISSAGYPASEPCPWSHSLMFSDGEVYSANVLVSG